MYHVYVIRSIRTKQLYFGRTEDLAERLASHNSGKVTSTSKDRPWEFVYTESYKAKQDAVDRELQLKQYGNARTYVKRRLRASLS
jgi:predicted GIY-YIG superfamily endonuclease